MEVLPNNLYSQIINFCEEGDRFIEQNLAQSALEKYFNRLDLIPELILKISA